MWRTPLVPFAASVVLVGCFTLAAVAESPQSTERVDIPAEARAVLANYAAETERVQDQLRRLHEQLAAARERTISQLQAVQDNYTRAADLDAALAVREQIRALRATDGCTERPIASSKSPQPANARSVSRSPVGNRSLIVGGGAHEIVLDRTPDTMAGHRDQLGVSYVMKVRAANGGTTWGTNVYTHDSSIAAAAIHSGLLRPNEIGYLRVTMLPGPRHFFGSTCHDIRSHDWDNAGGHYAAFVLSLVEKADETTSIDRSDVDLLRPR